MAAPCIVKLMFINCHRYRYGFSLRILCYSIQQALAYCIKCCFFSITWSLVDLEEKHVNGMDIDSDVQILRERLHAYVDQCKSIIQQGYDKELKEEVSFKF